MPAFPHAAPARYLPTAVMLKRHDDKAASALSLELAGKIVSVLDCGIEDLLEVSNS